MDYLAVQIFSKNVYFVEFRISVRIDMNFGVTVQTTFMKEVPII